MATTAAARRLSPKVRRLLAEHDVVGRGVPGTGAGGRLRPRDVLAAAGVPWTAGGTVLASPLARRLLREADIGIEEAAAATDGRRLTRVEAEDLVDDRSGGRRPGAVTGGASPRRRGAGGAVEEAADVAELLALVTAGQAAFESRNGFRLDLIVPVAVAVAAMIARDGDRRGEVAVGFHDGTHLRTVRDAQDLTVTGLARRARSASPVAVDDRSVAPTIIVTTGPGASVDALARAAEVGVVDVDGPTVREVRRTDRLGHGVVRERPHVTLRLHHAPGAAEEARSLLAGVRDRLASWTLPVDS